MNALLPLRGAQVKWKKPGTLLNRKEIEDEVANARGFDLNGLKLGAYTILTTSENDTDIQATVIELNTLHRPQGLFHIELLTWDIIEDALTAHPALWDRLVARSLNALVAPLVNCLDNVQVAMVKIDTNVEQLVTDSGATVIVKRIDEAKSLLDKHDYQAASLLLNTLRNNEWHTMQPSERFRVLTNLGAVANADGRLTEAGRLYCEARQHLPDDERAKTNYAMGLLLLDDRQRAYDQACELITEFPESVRPWVHYCNSAPETVSVTELLAKVPAHLQSNEEIMVNLALRALRHQDLQSALQFAETAQSPSSEWPAPWLIAGQAKAQLILRDSYKTQTVFPSDPDSLHACIEVLDKAVTLARQTRHRYLLSESLLFRARCHDFTGNFEACQSDLLESRELMPNDAATLAQVGLVLLQNGRTEEGLMNLRRAVELGGDPDTRFLLARSLRASESAMPDECIRLAITAARTPGGAYQILAIEFVLEEYLEPKRFEEARDFIAGFTPEQVDPLVLRCADTRVWQRKGNDAEAAKSADEITRLLSLNEYSVPIRRFVAATLSITRRGEQALPVWQSVVAESHLIIDAWNAVETARSIQRVDVVRAIASEWRSKGIADERLIDSELDVLDRFAPLAAMKLLQELLSNGVDNPHHILRLAILGIRLGKPDLISADVAMYPPIETVRVQNGVLAAMCLSQAGAKQQALTYSYRLLRRHPKSQKAHESFCFLMLLGGVSIDNPPNEEVQANSAVELKDTSSGSSRWVIIETEEGRGFDDEILMESDLAQLLLGKRVGDKVSFAGDALYGRSATLEKIVDRHIYRMNNLMNDNQILFPQTPAFQMYRIQGGDSADGGLPDITPIMSQLHEAKRQSTDKLDLYRRNPVPLHLLAQSLGRHFMTVQSHLALTEDLFIRCWEGDVTEAAQLSASIPQASEVVLDLSVLTTLYLLSAEHLLQNLPLRFIVSTGTLTELRHLLDRRVMTKSTDYMQASDRGIGFDIFAITEEQRLAEIERLRSLITLVEKSTRITDCWALAEVDPPTRDIMLKAFGQHGAESILLAKTRNRLLWTDDATIAIYGDHQFGVRRVWSQLVLQYAALQAAIPATQFHEASARLIGFDYQGTSFNAETLLAACRLSNWSSSQQPLKQMLDLFGRPFALYETLRVVIDFLRRIYSTELLAPEREDVVMAILDRVASIPEGKQWLAQLERNLRTVFGMNVIAERMARKLFLAWNRLHS
eukprot:TRINITY_DN1222_c0_g1_i1.p1 TRINITY_DN1222_c0_g1~~TRINITY_DN1222_c0_g1_i1.p1  ORF type:complete len:1228 (+),score=188.45 TRINITY_DN1222_c0_g1_i1:4744-8427(+)